MKIAILFRGISFSDRDTIRPWGVDWRRGYNTYKKFLLDPARAKWETETFTVSYKHNLWQRVQADYETKDAVWLDTGFQKQTFLRGLQLVKDNGPFDLVIACRFDLELLTDITALDYKPDCINFLWREWNQRCWDEHRRVADAIHILDYKLLDAFIKGVEDTFHDHCLHLVWHPTSKYCGVEKLNYILPDIRDSNPAVQPNPIYNFIRC